MAQTTEASAALSAPADIFIRKIRIFLRAAPAFRLQSLNCGFMTIYPPPPPREKEPYSYLKSGFSGFIFFLTGFNCSQNEFFRAEGRESGPCRQMKAGGFIKFLPFNIDSGGASRPRIAFSRR
jgi:hypothetical protein